jgi:hypothetical protein
MRVLSIDVGIKNLSFCLFNGHIIEKWDNINLLDEFKCECLKPAKYTHDNKWYCLKCAKKTAYIIQDKKIALSKYKLNELIVLANKYNIITSGKRDNIILLLNEYFKSNCLIPIPKKNAAFVDLITIGINLKTKFNTILGDCLNNIDAVIIENQIGPLANKMKTLQGMISQYFIMNNIHHIEFISACNKLKDFTIEKMDYKQRKKFGIQKCLEIISNSENNEWLPIFNQNNKKDDLSDCFLQGLWYITHKL